MALQSASGALAQPIVGLPEAPGRFVRLVWARPGRGAGADRRERARRRRASAVAVDSTRRARVRAERRRPPAQRRPSRGERALHFDLGGVLPLIDVDLRFDAGTHVAPVRLQGRARADQPWRELGSGVFYRIERDGEVGTLAGARRCRRTSRFLRVVPDERAASLDGVAARLVVHASLASLVFAAQGEPPFRLLAGSRDAPAGALPVSDLVPQLDSERARFGRATLGAFASRRSGRARRRAGRRGRRACGLGCSGAC